MFRRIFVITVILLRLAFTVSAQRYPVSIEPYSHLVKADPRLVLRTGYLVVPENRIKPNGGKG